MKSLTLHIALGISAFVLCLYLLMPAQVAYRWDRKDIDPRVQLYGIHGTLWHGGALTADFASLRFESLEWQMNPLGLLLGQLRYGLQGATAAGRIEAVVSKGFGSTVGVRHLTGSIPLGQVGPLAHLPPTALAGRIDVNISSMRIGKQGVKSAEGAIDIQDLTWALVSPGVHFGNFHADISTEKSVVRSSIRDTAGPVEAKGSAEMTPGTTYSLDVMLRPRPNAQAAVVGWLQQLGRPDSEGQYRFHREGAF
jgi:hypothetical protein